MKKMLLICAFNFLFLISASAQTCLENAKITAPVLSEAAIKIYKTKLAEADADFKKAKTADTYIWLGRRTAYLGNYKEAINIFTEGLKNFPNDARFYRHRGHRFITLRCFDDAIRDFKAAAKLVKGKKDEIEPDGLPNARNIPTSTLQSNIFYHLGLAFYLKKDFTNALKAYRQAEKVSNNPDMLVATTHWLYMTLRRLDMKKEAEKLLIPFHKDFQVIENDDYLKLIRLYRGEIKPKDFINSFDDEANNLSNTTLGYGWGNWNLYNAQPEDGLRVFRFVTSGNQWASFGFIAAEAELKETPKSQSEIFWTELEKLCGKAFAGTVANAPADDTTFKGKMLMMHVRSCEKDRIRIPFFVGKDKSRTWVLTRQNDRILLKHDHRHEDGTPDKTTMYGGLTTSSGAANRQMFPADQQTAELIPAASSNVWWIDLQPDEFFSYNLRRMGTDRFFSIKFDLKKEIPAPSEPWGWKD